MSSHVLISKAALALITNALNRDIEEGKQSRKEILEEITSSCKEVPQEFVTTKWLPIKHAPRDGTNLLLRFGSDGVSQGKYVPGLPHPWKFIDTNDGITWLINHAVDAPGGPSHYCLLPE